MTPRRWQKLNIKHAHMWCLWAQAGGQDDNGARQAGQRLYSGPSCTCISYAAKVHATSTHCCR